MSDDIGWWEALPDIVLSDERRDEIAQWFLVPPFDRCDIHPTFRQDCDQCAAVALLTEIARLKRLLADNEHDGDHPCEGGLKPRANVTYVAHSFSVLHMKEPRAIWLYCGCGSVVAEYGIHPTLDQIQLDANKHAAAEVLGRVTVSGPELAGLLERSVPLSRITRSDGADINGPGSEGER